MPANKTDILGDGPPALQALRVFSQLDGRLAAAYQPADGIQIAAAEGPVLAIATGQRVECLLVDSGAGTLTPLAAWQFEQQVSAVALLEIPDGEGSETQARLADRCAESCLRCRA